MAAHKGEAFAKLQDQCAQMVEEPAFQRAFGEVIGEPQELEVVRILEQLSGQVGVRRRQGLPEVLGGLLRIPQPLGRLLQRVEEADVMARPPRSCAYRTGCAATASSAAGRSRAGPNGAWNRR